MRRVFALVFVLLMTSWMLFACLAGGCFGGDCGDLSGSGICAPGEAEGTNGCYKLVSPRDASCSEDSCRG